MHEKPSWEELEKRIQVEQAEYNRSEEKLIHSYGLMDYIISHARSAIVVFDRDFKYIYVSKRYLKDYKVKEKNVIGKHHYEVFPDIPEKWKDVHQRSLAGEVLSSEEDPYYRSDGSIEWTRWECRPWYESDGSIGGIVIYNEIINERKKLEEKLKKSEQLLSTHLLNTPVGAVSWNLEFKAIEWNPAAELIFGYTREEAIGKHITELILPEDVTTLVDGVFQDLFAGIGGERSVNKNITKSGRYILCDWYNTVLKNLDGEIIGMASLVNDITDRKRSEDINKTLFAISNAVNITLNLNDLYKQIHCLLGEIIDVTNFFIAIVSEQKHTLYFPYYVDTFDEESSPITDFTPKGSLTGFVVSKRKPVLLKKEQLIELSKRKSVRGSVPLIWIGVPLIIKNEVIGVIAVQSYTDPHLYNEQDLQLLTSVSDQVAIAIDRKRSEAALRDSEKKYRHLFENAPAGMYEIDFIKSKFINVNEAMCEYSGYSEDEFLSMNPLDLLTEDSRNLFLARLESLGMNENISDNIEYNIIKKNGQELCVILSSDFIYDNGELKGARVVAHDITDRKKIEDMMIQTEKMMSVGGLAAGMAHEINNPLAGMMQNAQVIHNRLSKDLPTNEKVATELGSSMAVIKSFMEKRGILKQLENINQAGGHAAKIVKNMLSFARKSDSIKTEHHLNELIDNTINLSQNDYNLKKKYDFKQIQITREYNPDIPVVLCEGSKIQQVIFNLLKNAAESMSLENQGEKKPKLVLRLHKKKEMACIEIEDNGPGMDHSTRKRIFEPFFTTKSVDKGTGIGLSVSYFIIVNDHGGKIEVESIVGKGTKFIIKLPIE
jgi:PAS domain S-box-containing protein